MKIIATIILVLNAVFADCQIHHTITIVDEESQETIIGAEIYSFFMGKCFGSSDIEGKIKIETLLPNDTIFQIQALGYKHKIIKASGLFENKRISLSELQSVFSLGSKELYENEYNNFHHKCIPKDAPNYPSRLIKGKWYAKWNSYISNSKGKQIEIGRTLTIQNDTLIEVLSLFNSSKIFNLYAIEIKNDTIRGKLLESRQLNDRNASENERTNIYSEIVVPICELRKDCPIFYKNNNTRMGYTKGARPPMTWNQLIDYYKLQRNH